MTVQVFQVDPVSLFAPYDFEEERIASLGGKLTLGSCQTEADVIEQAGDAEILLVSWLGIVTPAVMDALPKLRLIVRWGVGYDMIDADAAAARGIAVANAPTYCGEEVAEHTIALLMAISRRIVWAHENIRAGGWTAPPGTIHRIKGRTLGIIGCGAIGLKVAERAQGLGLRVVGYDEYRPAESLRERGVEPMSFDEVLAQADYLTTHVPLNAGTRALIDAGALAKLKPGSLIVNTSRGSVIDQAALIAALESGHIAAAGLDVFEEEPLPLDSPLRQLPNVVLTPHLAATSIESLHLLRVEMCDTIGDWISTGWSPRIVNPAVKSNLRAR